MIAIVFALEFESAYFRANHNPRLRVSSWLLGTMGGGAAAILERKLGQTRPKLVVSAGFAGGLQSDIKVGDLILGGNFSDERVLAGLNLGPAWHVGAIQTVDAIIERAEDKRKLGQTTGALAGDLETAHLAKVCAAHDVPMLSVRCISDALEDDMPVPAHILMNPKDGRPAPLQLFQHLMKNPMAVAGFNRLLKNAKTAQKQLAVGLEEILPQLLRQI